MNWKTGACLRLLPLLLGFAILFISLRQTCCLPLVGLHTLAQILLLSVLIAFSRSAAPLFAVLVIIQLIFAVGSIFHTQFFFSLQYGLTNIVLIGAVVRLFWVQYRMFRCYKRGNYLEALRYSQRLGQMLPYIPHAQASSAEFPFTLKRYDEALAEFEAAGKKVPVLPHVIAGRAVTYHALGNLAQAQANWRALVALNPRYADVDWTGKILRWESSLVDEARKLVVGLNA